MKRKVLFFHRTLRQSGASRQMLNLFHGLDRDRWDPFYVLERDKKVFDRNIFDQARVYVLSHERDEPPEPIVQRLRGVLARETPDLIQSFNPRGNRYFYAASKWRRMAPLFCSIRNTHLDAEYLTSERSNERRRRGMIVNSEGIRRHLIRDGHLDPRRIHLVPNGLDVDLFSPTDPERREALRAKLGIAPDEWVVLAVGRVAVQKNLLCTLEALQRFRQRSPECRVRFVCVGKHGKSGYGKQISDRVRSLGLEESCLFTGPVHDVADYYRLADVMVLASEWEGLPNVLIENMACGGVSIVSDAADNDSIVADGRTGFKFSANDAAALCDRLIAVRRLLAEDLEAIGEGARKDVVERFSMERMIHSYEKIWLELASRGP